MANYLTPDALVPYITDTDLCKFAVLTTETDPVTLRYLDDWNITVNDAEIYLDGLVHRRKLPEFTSMTEISKTIQRLLGAYMSYKLALDRVANNPQQNLSDLTYDLYMNKLDALKDRWTDLENDLTDYDFTGIEDVEETSTSVITLYRR